MVCAIHVDGTGSNNSASKKELGCGIPIYMFKMIGDCIFLLSVFFFVSFQAVMEHARTSVAYKGGAPV